MRCGKEEAESSARGKDNRLKLLDDEYAIVHCTGYIKVRFIQDGTPGLEKNPYINVTIMEKQILLLGKVLSLAACLTAGLLLAKIKREKGKFSWKSKL